MGGWQGRESLVGDSREGWLGKDGRWMGDGKEGWLGGITSGQGDGRGGPAGGGMAGRRGHSWEREDGWGKTAKEGRLAGG